MDSDSNLPATAMELGRNMYYRLIFDKGTFTTGETMRVYLDNMIMSRVVRKPVFGVSDQVRHKPGCAVTEDG